MTVLIIFLHLLVFSLLTILTQVGGLIYLLSIVLIKKSKTKYILKRLSAFFCIYLVCNQIIIPRTAPIFGRERINETNHIEAATIWTALLNRNYVKPRLNHLLIQVSESLEKKYSGIKVIYLDANFPFYDGFPLPPHLSHRDGKKIDLSFIYKDSGNNLVNIKPSLSGYGVFTEPRKGEEKSSEKCISAGHWQYDMAKYLTLGKRRENLNISNEATKYLVQQIINDKAVQKIFIEPHLKQRFGLKNEKIRFHGCHAVRHDDHIHVQIL